MSSKPAVAMEFKATVSGNTHMIIEQEWQNAQSSQFNTSTQHYTQRVSPRRHKPRIPRQFGLSLYTRHYRILDFTQPHAHSQLLYISAFDTMNRWPTTRRLGTAQHNNNRLHRQTG